MEFKKLNEIDLSRIHPKNTRIVIKELSQTEKDEYLKLYNLYRKLFTEYIINILDLKKYDDEVFNSGLNFLINKEDDMDIYQYYSSGELKYFYIRNNIYIEKLDDEEKDFFMNKITNNDMNLDSKTEEVLKKTYSKVVFEDALENGEICNIQFGPNSSYFFAKNNSIIIGMAYDEFGEDGLEDSEWDKQHDKQKIFIYNLINEMNRDLEEKVDLPIKVIRYNEFSILKRKI